MAALNPPDQSILLLGNYRPTLPLSRTLALRGYAVVVGVTENKDHEIDFWKGRYVAAAWGHPDGDKKPTLFFEALLAFLASHPEIEAIFPVDETYVRLFSDHPEWDERLRPIIMNDPSIFHRCADKLSLMALAQRSNVPLAPFALAKNDEELKAALEELGFPLVLRPAKSTLALCFRKALVVCSSAEMDRLQIDWSVHSTGVILQKKVEGIRHNVYFTAFEAMLCGCMHSKMTRTNCLDGTGLAVEGVTVDPEGDLTQYTEQLIKALNYSGVGCAQYMVNPESGEITFLEINSRLPGHLAFAEYAGLRLGDFLVDMVLEGTPDRTPFRARPGIRFSWLSEDLKAVKTAWRKRDIPFGAAVAWGGRIMKSVGRSKVDVFFPRADYKLGAIAVMRVLPGIRRFVKGDPYMDDLQ